MAVQSVFDSYVGGDPISIITDQDKAMEGAIKEVFPNATHTYTIYSAMNTVKSIQADCKNENKNTKLINRHGITKQTHTNYSIMNVVKSIQAYCKYEK